MSDDYVYHARWTPIAVALIVVASVSFIIEGWAYAIWLFPTVDRIGIAWFCTNFVMLFGGVFLILSTMRTAP